MSVFALRRTVKLPDVTGADVEAISRSVVVRTPTLLPVASNGATAAKGPPDTCDALSTAAPYPFVDVRSAVAELSV